MNGLKNPFYEDYLKRYPGIAEHESSTGDNMRVSHSSLVLLQLLCIILQPGLYILSKVMVALKRLSTIWMALIKAFPFAENSFTVEKQ